MVAVKSSALVEIAKLEGDTLTPIAIFQRIQGQKKFLLESSLKHEEKGRYSFIGADPYKQVTSMGKDAVIDDLETGEQTVKEGRVLDVLKGMLDEAEIPDVQLPFFGGAVGYLGYDVIRQYEEIGSVSADELQMPEAHFMFYRDIICYDHAEQSVYIIALKTRNEQKEDLLARIAEKKKQILGNSSGEEPLKLERLEFKPSISQHRFEQMVEKAKEAIIAGEIFQVVLSQRLKADYHSDPFIIYRKLRLSNPSPYMFYIDFADYVVLGSSPESLIKVKNREVITNPIAGTRKRGETKEEDMCLETNLLEDEKELAEHKMLVDLGRNDLGRVCEVGSIEIPVYMKIERYKYVMHIVSEVSGMLTKNMSGLDALAACLPAGTVSGAPKIRAMSLISELEDSKRGVYSGAVGYVSFNGDLDFALAIRTMVIKDNTAFVQAGAGIVYDSVPETEFEETLNKAKALLEVSG
ncbi:anthranilate synthase component I [Bacillus sp. M6-12]|uniref:anthranilate synthase component I n=1 Tax=Bacillus sp. M6-12 TaxID=2054166 RepID=UPI000C79345B|nr:anthranilate synthase component I [Bacillus sp. M6-12]PLS16529.1 anthranilate synthase component I [Bacillus sp. M6-12]